MVEAEALGSQPSPESHAVVLQTSDLQADGRCPGLQAALNRVSPRLIPSSYSSWLATLLIG